MFTAPTAPKLAPKIDTDAEAVQHFQGRPFTLATPGATGTGATLELFILNTEGLAFHDDDALRAWAGRALYNTGHGPHYRAVHAFHYANGTARVLFA